MAGNKPKSEKTYTIQDLIMVMAKLRDPDGGCPWDLEQNFKSIAPYTLEEAYEVADAIEREHMDDLREELGDLLLQPIYHAQMAAEQDIFTIDDVIHDITHKMIHRHPHVFGDMDAKSPEDVNAIWDQKKATEKSAQDHKSALDGVALALPALLRAQKLQKKAAKVGFEWPGPEQVLDKLEEELVEMREALASGTLEDKKDELGDLLFVLTNLGRMLGVDAETALRDCNSKFINRFSGIEIDLKLKSKDIKDASLDEMEALWQAQKKKAKA